MQKLTDEMREWFRRSKEVMFREPPIEEFKGCSHYVETGSFGIAVVMSIGGIQYRLGIFSDHESAFRFADMASLRFRKYRRMLNWNFSEAQAIADTANSEDNGGVLCNWLLALHENRLRDSGLLKEISISRRQSARVLKAKRRTVESRIANLEGVAASLQNELNDAMLKIASLQDKVFLLESDNNSVVIQSAPQSLDTTASPAPAPIFYPTITCTDPSPSPHITNTPPTIWTNPHLTH